MSTCVAQCPLVCCSIDSVKLPSRLKSLPLGYTTSIALKLGHFGIIAYFPDLW